jgi:hypothetical protein
MGHNKLEDLEERIAILEQQNILLNRTDPAIALSTDLVDLGNVPIIRMRQTSVQSIGDSYSVKVTLGATDFDLFGDGADLSNDQAIIRRGGIYLIICRLNFVTNATGERFAGYGKGGSLVAFASGLDGGASHAARPIYVDTVEFDVGDTIQLFAFQASTASLDTNLPTTAEAPSLALTLLSSGT